MLVIIKTNYYYYINTTKIIIISIIDILNYDVIMYTSDYLSDRDKIIYVYLSHKIIPYNSI
uniref:Uncharacterized protein n=1 Tax=Moumouvirus sp. 'Monve' TaxID=1128131 RepID=H2EDJ1_9VIRU|nr:hypothetical protein mv_L259 [Moumouvirus Monve]